MDEAVVGILVRRIYDAVVAVIIAIGVNSDGRHQVLDMEVGTSEAELIWTEFLRKPYAPRFARREARRLRCA